MLLISDVIVYTYRVLLQLIVHSLSSFLDVLIITITISTTSPISHLEQSCRCCNQQLCGLELLRHICIVENTLYEVINEN